MNIQHSSKTDKWYTPEFILEKSRKVLGEIDFDPASDMEANKFVKAKYFLTEEKSGLNIENWLNLDYFYPQTIFLNPPGGKTGNKSNTALFWKNLMEFNSIGKLKHGIFLAFSAEALQNTQNKGCLSIGKFPFCVPQKRIRFVNPDRTLGDAPSHSNLIVYIPGTIDNRYIFIENFKDMGVIVNEKI